MQEAPRTTREQSSWAVISILVAILLCGFFWFWQMREATMSILAPTTLETAYDTNNTPKDEPDYTSLEASAVNISIPSFEEVF